MGGVLGAERCFGKPALSPEAATTVALLLGNDDLLREVLLRLPLPTSLVRAACVCKRWLRVASSPSFLHDFRILHPPRLLGSFPDDDRSWGPKFFPCRGLPAELAAMARRASGYLFRICRDEPAKYQILDIRNGRMLFYVTDMSDPVRLGTMICTPVQPAPPVYLPLEWHVGATYHGTNEVELIKFEFLPEDGGDGLSYLEVRVVKHRSGNPSNVVFATVVSCQAGVAGGCQATPPTMLPKVLNRSSCSKRGVLCGGKFYMLSKDGYILVLDLAAMSLFYIYLPDELQQDGEAIEYYGCLKNIELSRGDCSKLYLILIKGLKVFVWLHDAKCGSNTSNWALVDTICLLQVFAHVAKHDLGSEGCRISLQERSGDNAEFVYLSILDTTDDCPRTDYYLLHIKSRAVEKVAEEDWHTTSLLNPFTMVWPPVFPALDNEEAGHDHVWL